MICGWMVRCGVGETKKRMTLRVWLKQDDGWELAAHACNPSYSGVRDQEDHGSKPARANSLRDPISKKTWLKV
jgi:hypothetical protein